MATFTETDTTNIWAIFNLEREQLETGSSLRLALAALQDFDTANSTDLVTKAKDLIDLITEKSDEVSEAQDDAGIQSVNFVDDVSLTYKSSSSPVTVKAGQKQDLKRQLNNLLELDKRGVTSGTAYARVTGINASYAARSSRIY